MTEQDDLGDGDVHSMVYPPSAAKMASTLPSLSEISNPWTSVLLALRPSDLGRITALALLGLQPLGFCCHLGRFL